MYDNIFYHIFTDFMNTYKSIFFDFDSTLIQAESLDLLAYRKGCGDEVSRLTELSMNGYIPVDDIFKKKVEIINPHRDEVIDISYHCREIIVEGAKDVIGRFLKEGRDVYILSAGFKEIILPTAKALNIPEENIFANEFDFAVDGKYRGFKETCDPDLIGNKPNIIRKYLANQCQNECLTAMIGDSVSDMKCRGVVDLFIGFGGVVEREKVKKESEIYIYDIKEVLEYIY